MFLNTPENFVAGKVSYFIGNWTKITSDAYILDIIRNGYMLEFESTPCEGCFRKEIKFAGKEEQIIDDLLLKLQIKKVIDIVPAQQEQILSNIFIRPKSDGTYRLILNLSKLNDHICKKHFKMETLKTALQLIRKNCYFAKLDFKDAYFSIPVNKKDRKYLCFKWKNQIFEFTCLPNGLTSAPRIFTKVMKPVFSTLRKEGHTNCAYIDDALLSGDSYRDCVNNIDRSVNLVDDLGITIHPEKSIYVPTQCIEFVGFELNSVDMTVRLTHKKKQNMIMECEFILQQPTITIRQFAKLIGKMVSSEPGVQYAPLYYKSLEIQRDLELKINKGNFDGKMIVSGENRDCIVWWINNVDTSFKPIQLPKTDRVIESDSSLTGYGAHDVTHNKQFSGIWKDTERDEHINVLELKAAFLAVKYFCERSVNEHVQLMLDNTTAIKYIVKMGGRIPKLNKLVKEMWCWCVQKHIWITVYHIPGKLNTRADALSRQKLNDDMEWSLDINVFKKVMNIFGQCNIDMFASKKNCRLPKYVSYTPDCKAVAINAFSLRWNNYSAYMFPPFSLIGSVLQKIEQDEADATLVVPLFSTQPWFPRLLQMTIEQPRILPPIRKTLWHPDKRLHRLKKMHLGAFRVSGKSCVSKDYRRKLLTLSSLPGEMEPKNNTKAIWQSGCTFVVLGKLIHLIPI